MCEITVLMRPGIDYPPQMGEDKEKAKIAFERTIRKKLELREIDKVEIVLGGPEN